MLKVMLDARLALPPTDASGAYVLGPEDASAETTKGGTHYRLLGPADSSKGLVVLIHGIGDFSFRYNLLAPALAELGFRVAVLDFIGRGWSRATLFSPIRCDAESHSQEIKAVVEAVGFQGGSIHIVGHSMGGCAATHYVAEHAPPQLASLILMAPAGAMTPSPLGCTPCCYRLLQGCLGGLCGCCCIPAVGSLTNGKYQAKGFVGAGAGGTGGAGPVLTPAQISSAPALAEWDVAWVLASQRANGNNALAASAMRMPLVSIQSAVSTAARAALRARNLPVLVLSGADDVVVKGHNSRIYHSLFGEANITEEVTAGGHCFFLQDPETACTRIAGFIGRIGAAPVGMELGRGE